MDDERQRDEGTVEVAVSDHVAVVTLSRPPHNLVTEPLLRRLADALADLEGRCGAAVLAAEGRSFCAGADFRSPVAPDPVAGDDFEKVTGAFYEQAVRVFAAPVPVVAAVGGAAIGAGLGIALACDLRVAGERAWFQANFTRLGIHPGFALSATLPRLIGPSAAADVFLTGRRVGAAEAGRLGLADRVVGAGEERDAAVNLAAEIAAGAPLALARTRRTLRAGLVDLAAETMRHELAEQAALAGTPDAVEGVRAMLEGRPPRFARTAPPP